MGDPAKKLLSQLYLAEELIEEYENIESEEKVYEQAN